MQDLGRSIVAVSAMRPSVRLSVCLSPVFWGGSKLDANETPYIPYHICNIIQSILSPFGIVAIPDGPYRINPAGKT